MSSKVRAKSTKALAGLGIAAMIAGAVVVLGAAPVAQAAPSECSTDFYWVQGAQLYTIDPAATKTLTPVGGAATGNYNALGYNTEDGYLYALGTAVGVNQAHLLRIEDDGSVVDLGIPTGLPVASYIEGVFDETGTLWVSTIGPLANGTAIYGVDVSTNTAALVTLSQGIRTANDFAYYNGLLYTTSATAVAPAPLPRVIAINPATGAVTQSTGQLSVALGGAPAFFSNSSGHMYVYSSVSGGGIYEVLGFTTPTPSLQLLASGFGTFSGDGASCYFADSPFINAVDNDYTSTPLPLAGGTVAGILGNDLLRGAAATGASVTTTLLNDGGLVGAVLAGDNLLVPAAAAGTYVLDYQICDSAVPTLCDQATITVVLQAQVVAPPVTPPVTAGGPILPATGPQHVLPSTLGGLALAVLGLLLFVSRRFAGLARASEGR